MTGKENRVPLDQVDSKHQHNSAFHQAKWNEPIVLELHSPGQRGVLVPTAEPDIVAQVGDGLAAIPESLRRAKLPNLPEISQNRVLRHYLRLSQETLGADLNVEIGQGTCTMKYNPKVNEYIVRSSKVTDLHPMQHADTVQGMLEILHKTDLALREVSGMDRFSFQSGSGTQALFTMMSIIHAKHKQDGNAHKDEIITTIFSHPSQAATAAVKGFKVITLYPEEDGYPSLEKLKQAISPRTAGFVVANPEDTGIFNHRIREFTEAVHEVGGVCCYDQANANGLLGIARARDAGFDMCFFNLHKTFGTPHACGGPATGALGVTKHLEPYLPGPLIYWNEEIGKYQLTNDLPHSIGKVRSYLGVPQNVVRAYSWIASLGPEGLEEVAKVAVLNNNYLYHHVRQIRGASAPYVEGQRLEQVRYSWNQMYEDTGVTTEDVQRRMVDFGLHYWTSHHPYVVPQPFTLEPTESYSKSDLDEYLSALRAVSKEAYSTPEAVQLAPYHSTIHKIDGATLDNPEEWAISWRAYVKKHKHP